MSSEFDVCLHDVMYIDVLRRLILTYAWIPTVLSLRGCCADIHRLIMRDYSFMNDIINAILLPSGRSIDDYIAHRSLWDVVSMGSRITTWPTAVSTLCDGSGSVEMIANDHWPVLGGDLISPSLRPACRLPFTKVTLRLSFFSSN